MTHQDNHPPFPTTFSSDNYPITNCQGVLLEIVLEGCVCVGGDIIWGKRLSYKIVVQRIIFRRNSSEYSALTILVEVGCTEQKTDEYVAGSRLESFCTPTGVGKWAALGKKPATMQRSTVTISPSLDTILTLNFLRSLFSCSLTARALLRAVW